jgi:hypothetical protein
VGCELVAADMNDKASLVAAFKDCHGAFLVTNFWEGLDAEKEVCCCTKKWFANVLVQAYTGSPAQFASTSHQKKP